jgi:hypothetical protein
LGKSLSDFVGVHFDRRLEVSRHRFDGHRCFPNWPATTLSCLNAVVKFARGLRKLRQSPLSLQSTGVRRLPNSPESRHFSAPHPGRGSVRSSHALQYPGNGVDFTKSSSPIPGTGHRVTRKLTSFLGTGVCFTKKKTSIPGKAHRLIVARPPLPRYWGPFVHETVSGTRDGGSLFHRTDLSTEEVGVLSSLEGTLFARRRFPVLKHWARFRARFS